MTLLRGQSHFGSPDREPRQGLTVVHFSTQPEPFVTQNTLNNP